MVVFLGDFFKNIVTCAVACFRLFAARKLKFVKQNLGKLFRRIRIENSASCLVNLLRQLVDPA